MKRAPSYYWSGAGTKCFGFGAYDSYSPYIAHTSTTIGSDVSNYREKLVKKQDASSNYSTSFYEEITNHALQSNSTVLSNGQESSALSWLKHSNVFTPVNSIPHNAGLDDQALKRIKGKLASSQEYFKALMPLAELKETRGLIKSTAEITTNLLKDALFLKRDWNSSRYRKDVVKHLSDAWLQYSFAISPTVGDIDQLLKTVTTSLTARDHTTHVTGGSRLNWSSEVGSPVTYNAAYALKWKASQLFMQHSLTYKYTAGLSFDVQNSNDYSSARQFGLTLGDVVPAAYELFPFSWVMDYFTTMGDFLDDAFVSSAGNTIYCTKSSVYEVRRNRNYVLSNPSPLLVRMHKEERGTVVDKTLRYERVKLASLPHRSFRVKSVDEVAKNSVNKLLNLTSVLIQLHK